MRLDVNVDGAIQLTARLERLNRSAFPLAVRSTLNDLAFESKKIVPTKAASNFTIRQKNLFKKFVLVNKANGFNVNSMRSEIGIDSQSQPKLSKGLETQELGGNLTGRKLIANDKARVSGSNAKKIKSKYNFRNMPKMGTRNNRIAGAKFFIIKKGNKGTVFENKGSGLIAIYTYRSNPVNRLQSKPFIKPSALKASEKTLLFYQKNADYQFNRALRR